MDIPTQQVAAIKTPSTTRVEIRIIDVPEPGPHQLLVEISHSGLCGTDRSYLYDEDASMGVTIQPSSLGISGHEGAGVVVKLGPDVNTEEWKIGEPVGIKWVRSVYPSLPIYHQQTPSPLSPPYQPPQLTPSPTPRNIPTIRPNNYPLHHPPPLPPSPPSHAAPLLCGGVTAYVACLRSRVLPNQYILILGADDGVGHLAIQYALSLSMRVIATDTSASKRELCLSLGTEHFIDYASKTPAEITVKVMGITTHGAHGVIVAAGSEASYALAPSSLRPGGTMVGVGIPKGGMAVPGPPPVLLIMKKLSVVGESDRTMKEEDEALAIVARGDVKPILTMGKMEDLNGLVGKLDKGEVVGRVVIEIPE